MLNDTRVALGFHNPNHAAEMVCAVVPFCWGWKRARGLGWLLSAAALALLALTQSRTGFLVFGFEAAACWLFSKERLSLSRLKARKAAVICVLALAALGVLSQWPRLALDDSILNRPRIWLAGLRLFAANPSGVGLGNSGTVASAFLLPDIPEIRTMISAHVTLLAEFGWMAGIAWFAFAAYALTSVRRSPRAGIAFAGLLLSCCSSTIFDWPVLLDPFDYGGPGIVNWILSWLLFLLFAALGARLVVRGSTGDGSRPLLKLAASAAAALVIVAAALLVPRGDAPVVRDGYAARGAAPATLVLYSRPWTLRTILPRVKEPAVMPVHPVSRFPRDLDLKDVGRVVLCGDCREWTHLVKGAPAECAEEQ